MTISRTAPFRNVYQLIVTNNGVPTTMEYDLDGNLSSVMTASSTNTYQWDAANRLVSIAGPTNRSVFGYDGLGRRTQIVEWQNGVAVATNNFVWDGQAMLDQRDNTGTNVTRRFFVQGEQISGTNYYFTRDHLGSVREVDDASGVMLARYDYDPYGRQTLLVGTAISDFGYAGMYLHAPSGLNLTLYRAYNSDLGRWPNRDPIGENGGINLYGYVGNNPLNHIDPLGLSTYFDENYGDISSYQNPANLPVVGAYVGAGVAAGAAVTGVGALVDAYGASVLAWLGLGGAAAETPEGQAEMQEAEQALANAANTVKSCPAPSLIGNTSPAQSILKAVYNADTRQIAVQFPATQGTHAEIAVDAGWGESPNLIGGYLNFSGGNITLGDWLDASGLLPGTPELATQAQAATQAIISNQ